MRAIGLLSAVLLVPGFRDASCYVPDPAESRVWIEGRTTVSRFTCRATRVEGVGEVVPEGTVQAWLAVPVRAFDCGRPAMNRDLQEALQADRFPAIRFVLGEVAVLEAPTADSARLEVAGALTIAGTMRTVRFVAGGRLLASGRARLVGSLPLQLTDFNVKPPTALLGLIRVHDQITVHFDLVVHPVAWRPCAVAAADSLNDP